MPDDQRVPVPDADDAIALIDRLRSFADGLGPAQRQLLAALLAPGIDAAWHRADPHDDRPWSPAVLPEQLAAAVRDRPLRIVEG